MEKFLYKKSLNDHYYYYYYYYWSCGSYALNWTMYKMGVKNTSEDGDWREEIEVICYTL